MDDITATLRVESSELPLTETLAYDDTATVQPVSGAGTVPNLGAHLFTVRTDDFDRFETALDRDRTIESFERVVELQSEAVYSFEYGPEATVFSAAIAERNGISLDWSNDDTAWTVRVWLPDRAGLSSLWEWATEQDIEFSLEQVGDYANPVETEPDLTQTQREAIVLAFEMGYFEEPRAATLSDVAAELDISQPAAGGLVRRAVRRLVASTVADGADSVADER